MMSSFESNRSETVEVLRSTPTNYEVDILAKFFQDEITKYRMFLKLQYQTIPGNDQNASP